MEGHGPSSHVSGPEGFAANLLVWDTTAHLCGREEGFFNATQQAVVRNVVWSMLKQY